jgi:adenylate cyclase
MDDREEGIRLAREALATGTSETMTLSCVASALGTLACDAAGAWAVARRALALNPNSGWVRSMVGWTELWCGAAEPAMEHFNRAIALSPLDPDLAFMIGGLAQAHLMAGRPIEALAAAEDAVRLMPTYSQGYKIIIAALTALGRREEAVAAAERCRVAVPAAARVAAEARRRLYVDQDFAESFSRALCEAGLPD